MAKASDLIKLAQSWVGKNEADGSHKEIIDIYNGHKPLARGYKVKYTDAWCATTVSALAIKLGCTDIIPTECGCGEMVNLFQALGVWVEDESVKNVQPGWIIFYDWQDNGVGDSKGWPDHTGVVEKVAGDIITVIEGNYKDAVSRRTIGVNAKNIRGYACPKYEPEEVTYAYNGVDYSLVFNPDYYSERYSDLKKAYGSDKVKLFNHFTKYGMKEGRMGCATFDVKYYKAEYKDLQKAYGDNLPAYYKHYIQYGHKEGRRCVQKYEVRLGNVADKSVAESIAKELVKLGYEDAKVYKA